MSKWILTTLRGIQYKEDHGSINSFDCQGTYKYQHDTGKNLKFVHVFPKAVEAPSEGNEDELEEDNKLKIPEGVKKDEWFCLISTDAVFQKICSRKISTWTQLSRCKELFKNFNEKFITIEQKLASMKALDELEEFIYSEVVEIPEKLVTLTKKMKKLVDEGQLTLKEKNTLIEKLKEKLPKTEKKLKTLETLETKDILEVNRFRQQVELKKLLRSSLPLILIEEKAGPKGLWSPKLNAQELQLLKLKLSCDEKIRALFTDELCYFETEEEFQKRKDLLVKSVQSTVRTKKVAAKTLGNNGGWGSVAPQRKKKIDFSKGVKKPNTGAFSALMD